MVLAPEYKNIKNDDTGKISYLPYDSWIDLNDRKTTFYYDSLYQVDHDRYIGFAGTSVRFIDPVDSCYFSYDNLNYDRVYKGITIVRQKNKYGLLDSIGHILFPVQYDTIVILPRNVLLKTRNDSGIGWMVGDHYGDILNSGLFEKYYLSGNSRLMVRRKGYWGMLNKDGTEKINCIYDSIGDNVNGLINVTFHKESGILWKNNWLVYPGKYQITLLKDQKILINEYSGSLILNVLGDTLYRSGNILEPLNNFFLDRNSDKRYGLLNEHFERILYPVCFHITPLPGDSVFIFYDSLGWGAVNERGQILFSNVSDLDTILSYSEGFFKVIIDGKFGFIDTQGILRIANRYEDAGEFINGLAPVKLLGLWGFIDKNERLVIQPFYDKVCLRTKNLMLVGKNNKYGIISASGQEIQEFDYDSFIALPDSGFLCNQGNLYGYINKFGIFNIVPRFDHLEPLHDGMLIAVRNQKFGVLSCSGETIIPVIYDALKYDRSFNRLWGCIHAGWKNLK